MRKIAFKVITEVEENNSFVNLALKDIESQYMSQITIRVYGYLQNKLYLEYLVNEMVDRKKIDPTVKRILQLAVFEKLYLDSSPDYAIINEYSAICRTSHRDALSFVSFILNNKLSSITHKEPTFTNEVKNLSIKYSYPQAMLKLLIKQYPDNYLEIVKSTLEQKRITGRYLNMDAPTPYFFKDFTLCNLSDEDFKNGKIVIQDLGSYLIVKYLNPINSVLDLCAAPGIKTMNIAKYATNVYANEINSSRYKKLMDNIEKNDFSNVTCINHDASSKEDLDNDIFEVKFDKILIDAPCSGSGVFGSKPDLKYRQNLNEVNEIISLQKNILENALNYLKPDGEIVYSTCSLNKNENEEVVKEMMTKHNLEFVEDPEIAKFAVCGEVGYTILPYTNHSDGFYMCKLKRK